MKMSKAKRTQLLKAIIGWLDDDDLPLDLTPDGLAEKMTDSAIASFEAAAAMYDELKNEGALKW